MHFLKLMQMLLKPSHSLKLFKIFEVKVYFASRGKVVLGLLCL